MNPERFLPSLARLASPFLLSPGGNKTIPPLPVKLPELLYIHIPYCRELCPFCSFVRYPYEAREVREYFASLSEEIRMWKSAGASFSEIYIGGGSPAVDPLLLSELIRELRSLFPVRSLSVETNPDALNDESVSLLSASGIDRLSVGIQSLDDAILRTLGRREKYGGAASLEAKLREFSRAFPVLNADMIFNTPGQTESILRRDIGGILRSGVTQTTFYPLMSSRAPEGDSAREKDFYGILYSELSAVLEPVSVWCFGGRSGASDEYVIRHPSYAGAGCGAFSFIDGTARINTFEPGEYSRFLARGLFPVKRVRVFGRSGRMLYEILMRLFGFRLDPEQVRESLDGRLPSTFHPVILFLRSLGWIETRPAGDFILTGRGRYPWLLMMKEFFQSVNRFRSSFLEKRTSA